MTLMDVSNVSWPNCHIRMPQSELAVAELDRVVEEKLSDMNVEQKVSQLIQAELASISPKQAGESCVGSILNGGGVYPHGNKHASVRDWYELAYEFYDASSRSDAGIPILWGTDAVHGHNNVLGATLFPHNIGLGVANDPELMRRIGEETARDIAATGIQWAFAPTLAVPRDYRWGRSYEGYSQDPRIVARLGSAVLKGLQGSPFDSEYLGANRVLGTSKHFLGEGATTDGIDQGDVDCCEATLRQTHSCGHIAALESGAQIVMAAFNSWRGMKVHSSRYLLTEVLKQKMGFTGFVISDWDGFAQIHADLNRSIVVAVNAGVDMLMISSEWQKVRDLLLDAVRTERISEQRINDSVTRILRVKALSGLLPGSPTFRRMPAEPPLENLNRLSAKSVAREAVRKSLVLFKNDDQLLPLKRKQKIAIVGRNVEDISRQCGGWSVTWQGDGNTNADFPYATSIVAGIRTVVEQANGEVEFIEDIADGLQADAAIVLFGESPYAEGEGDINHLSFSAQDSHPLDQLRRLQAVGIPTVALFLTGRPRWINPELNASNALVVCWLPGTEGAGVADVLFRDEYDQVQYDFDGRLSFSWPLDSNETKVDEDSANPDAYLPVGYGLSYRDIRTFEWLEEADQTTLPVYRGWNNQGSYNYPR